MPVEQLAGALHDAFLDRVSMACRIGHVASSLLEAPSMPRSSVIRPPKDYLDHILERWCYAAQRENIQESKMSESGYSLSTNNAETRRRWIVRTAIAFSGLALTASRIYAASEEISHTAE